MASDPMLNKKNASDESEKSGVKQKAPAASNEIRVASQNFIKIGLGSVVQSYGVVAGNLDKLPQAQKYGVLAVAGFVLFWPLFGVIMLLPWIFGGFILAYSLLLGFETLVTHTEEALLSELSLSPANAGRVKDISKGLKSNYQTFGKTIIEKGYTFALVAVTSGSAIALQYAQKALNYVISNLQQAKVKTDATSSAVSEKAENLKQTSKAATAKAQ